MLLEESIIESYHCYFSELNGEESMLKKHIFEYFQSESRAAALMNPIVFYEVVDLLVDKLDKKQEGHDLKMIEKRLVDIVSLICAVSMYFNCG